MLRKADGSPYTVFTPFSKHWKSLPFSYAPAELAERLNTPILASEVIPDLMAPPGFPAGEAEALRRLDSFLAGPGADYSDGRNRLDLEGTSALSPYLRFGMLSPRLACQRVMEKIRSSPGGQASKGYETWLNELIWREFYNAILYEFPEVLHTAFKPALRAIRWREAPDDLAAWQAGQTGYPVVDAAMRQLNTTGWMHNRARMIVASFLVKDLLIDWRKGEAWFMRQLVDGDPAANNGGWQWTAGVGTDAAPYFRIFNPLLQSQKFDPQGAYIRRWLPELTLVPDAYIHAPWTMPIELQNRLSIRIGSDYPAPIVEHAVVRERVLAAFKGSQPAV
jgi:deoxyribodipyrimidine photo-lyase